MKYDLTHAIRNLYPNGAKYVQEGLEYSGLKWVDERPKPTKSEIDAEVKRLQAEYDANAYGRKRAISYPEIKEQLDLLYHDMVAGKGDKTGEWFKAIKKVKDDTPKP